MPPRIARRTYGGVGWRRHGQEIHQLLRCFEHHVVGSGINEFMHVGKRLRRSTKVQSWRSTSGLLGDKLEWTNERREKAIRAFLAWSSRNRKSKPFPKYFENDENDISVENINVLKQGTPLVASLRDEYQGNCQTVSKTKTILQNELRKNINPWVTQTTSICVVSLDLLVPLSVQLDLIIKRQKCQHRFVGYLMLNSETFPRQRKHHFCLCHHHSGSKDEQNLSCRCKEIALSC